MYVLYSFYLRFGICEMITLEETVKFSTPFHQGHRSILKSKVYPKKINVVFIVILRT